MTEEQKKNDDQKDVPKKRREWKEVFTELSDAIKIESKIDQSVAVSDLQRMIRLARIDIEAMSEFEAKIFEHTTRKLSRLIETRQMEIGMDGLPSIHIGHPSLEWLRFKRIPASALAAQGSNIGDETVLKNFAMLAEATDTPVAVISECADAKNMNTAVVVMGMFLEF